MSKFLIEQPSTATEMKKYHYGLLILALISILSISGLRANIQDTGSSHIVLQRHFPVIQQFSNGSEKTGRQRLGFIGYEIIKIDGKRPHRKANAPYATIDAGPSELKFKAGVTSGNGRPLTQSKTVEMFVDIEPGKIYSSRISVLNSTVLIWIEEERTGEVASYKQELDINVLEAFMAEKERRERR